MCSTRYMFAYVVFLLSPFSNVVLKMGEPHISCFSSLTPRSWVCSPCHEWFHFLKIWNFSFFLKSWIRWYLLFISVGVGSESCILNSSIQQGTKCDCNWQISWPCIDLASKHWVPPFSCWWSLSVYLHFYLELLFVKESHFSRGVLFSQHLPAAMSRVVHSSFLSAAVLQGSLFEPRAQVSEH